MPPEGRLVAGALPERFSRADTAKPTSVRAYSGLKLFDFDLLQCSKFNVIAKAKQNHLDIKLLGFCKIENIYAPDPRNSGIHLSTSAAKCKC